MYLRHFPEDMPDSSDELVCAEQLQKFIIKVEL